MWSIGMPEISVVMATYNSCDTLSTAINSIISQSFIDWELIIVDDGSSDESMELLLEYQAKDSRISIIKNKKNMGLPYCLNLAIEQSKCDFIARMDDDDISYPERLKTQLSYMYENEYVDVLGCSAKMVNHERSIVKIVNMPRHHEDCLRYLPKSTPFIHPSVMIRRRFFEKNGVYNASLKKAQDYELRARGAQNSCYENLQAELIEYALATTKKISTIKKEIMVRTLCAYKYHYLPLSLMYSLHMFLYYSKNIIIHNLIKKLNNILGR